MKSYELTLRQYQKQELAKFKNTPYWKNSLKLSVEFRKKFINSKLEKIKRDWYEFVIEYGRDNRLENKVIYSFDREYGREHLLHVFRGNRRALDGWINTDAIGY